MFKRKRWLPICHVIKQYDGTLVIKIQHILTKNECRRSDKNSRNSTCAKIKCCYIIKDGKGLWDDINSLLNIRFHFHKIFKYFSTKKKKTPQNSPKSNFYLKMNLRINSIHQFCSKHVQFQRLVTMKYHLQSRILCWGGGGQRWQVCRKPLISHRSQTIIKKWPFNKEQNKTLPFDS